MIHGIKVYSAALLVGDCQLAK